MQPGWGESRSLIKYIKMDLLKYFTQLKRFFSKLKLGISIFYTKHLPMDLGHQEVPGRGEKKNMTLFMNIFLYLQVNLHFKKNFYLNFINMTFI